MTGNCTVCGSKIDWNHTLSIKWDEKPGGMCHKCVISYRRTFKRHDHQNEKKNEK